jgi:hypothetical protein
VRAWSDRCCIAAVLSFAKAILDARSKKLVNGLPVLGAGSRARPHAERPKSWSTVCRFVAPDRARHLAPSGLRHRLEH